MLGLIMYIRIMLLARLDFNPPSFIHVNLLGPWCCVLAVLLEKGPLFHPFQVPRVQSSLRCCLTSTPLLQVHPSHPSTLLPFLYHGGLVDLPVSPQCGCISVPLLCFVWSVSWQQTTAMTRLQGRESPLCITAAYYS